MVREKVCAISAVGKAPTVELNDDGCQVQLLVLGNGRLKLRRAVGRVVDVIRQFALLVGIADLGNSGNLAVARQLTHRREKATYSLGTL